MPGSGSVLPDTNVVLRYLLKDVPEQYAQAEKFFEGVRQLAGPVALPPASITFLAFADARNADCR